MQDGRLLPVTVAHAVQMINRYLKLSPDNTNIPINISPKNIISLCVPNFEMTTVFSVVKFVRYIALVMTKWQVNLYIPSNVANINYKTMVRLTEIGVQVIIKDLTNINHAKYSNTSYCLNVLQDNVAENVILTKTETLPSAEVVSFFDELLSNAPNKTDCKCKRAYIQYKGYASSVMFGGNKTYLTKQIMNDELKFAYLSGFNDGRNKVDIDLGCCKMTAYNMQPFF